MNNYNKNNRQVVSRFYNQIFFEGDKVIKGAPEDRFIKETEWFREAEKRIPDYIPHIYSYNKKVKGKGDNKLRYYEMQAIDGSNLYQWANENKDNFSEIFNKLIELTKELHSKSSSPKPDDIYQMYYLKPKVALTEFINKSGINTNSIIINDHKYSDPVNRLESVYQRMGSQFLSTKYSFIHGDLTMSNILISREGKLYLIDPRGCFGNTNLYGDVRYDIAKIYYSIVGNFDSLNNGKFNYQRKSKNRHSYSIVDNGFGNYEKNIIEGLGEQYEIIRFIHATIWLSLIPHVANNPEQQWCTFCNGIYLLNTINK